MPRAAQAALLALGLVALARPCGSLQFDVPVPPVVRLCVQSYPPFVVMRVRSALDAPPAP